MRNNRGLKQTKRERERETLLAQTTYNKLEIDNAMRQINKL